MAIGPDLFTRVELRQKTGIPDDVLNYWMREDVLRAREGGEGRGNPRRFDYPEVMLAAILDQLRGFGLSVAALKGLSDRFHAAIDFFREHGLTRKNFHEFQTLRDAKTMEERELPVYGRTTEPEKYPQYEWEENKHRPGIYLAKLDFETLVGDPSLWRAEDASDEDVQLALSLIGEIDLDEYDAHYWYWSALTEIHARRFSNQPDHFERDSLGNWHMTRGDPTGRSWISVDTSAINFELWEGDRSLRG